MKKSEKRLIMGIWCMSVILQLLHIFITGDTIAPDEYKGIALQHVLDGKYFYPNWDDFGTETIIAPGWINLAILLLRIIPDYHILYLFNTLATSAIVFFIFHLCIKFINERVAWSAVLIFSLYPTWSIMVNRGTSEIPYLLFFFLGIYLLTFKSYYLTFVAGLSIGYANWIRPFLPVMLITALLLIWFFHKNIRKRVWLFLGGCAIFILMVGIRTYYSVGRFEYQSNMQGFNILLGAHDGANGCFNMEGEAFVIEDYENTPYYERDKIYMDRAIDWIKKNPVKWLSLMPRKFLGMFGADSHATIAQDPNCQISKLIHARGSLSFWQIVTYINWVIYYTIMILSLYGIYLTIKKKKIFLLIWTLFLCMTIGASMLTVGINRYHFVMMPIFIILAASAIDHIMEKYRKNPC